MRPDDFGAWVVREQDEQRFLVAMRMQIEIVHDREVHDFLTHSLAADWP